MQRNLSKPQMLETFQRHFFH